MAKYQSVSKSCFVHKKPKGKKLPKSNFKLNCSYSKILKQIDEEFENVQNFVSSQVFNDVATFVQQCQSNYNNSNVIPTAAFLTGVNLPDHKAIFTKLQDVLQDKVTPYVAKIPSSCITNTGVKAIINNFVSQIVNNELDSMSEDINKKKCTLPVLSAWYMEKSNLAESESLRKIRKRKLYGKDSKNKIINAKLNSQNNKNAKNSIVIIIEDLEGFNSNVITQFISILSEYSSTLPLILVFGISTEVTMIHQLLSQSILGLLQIEKFSLNSPIVHLNAVMCKIFLNSEIPFKLGSNTFKLLKDIFFSHDFSVDKFIHSLKICLMEYCCSHSFHSLCCNLNCLDSEVSKLDHNVLEELRKCPSFREYVESKQPKEQRNLLLNDDFMKKSVRILLEDIHEYHKFFYPVVDGLFELSRDLPSFPFGKQVHELYLMCLEISVAETSHYDEMWKLLRLLSKKELYRKIKFSLDTIISNLSGVEISEVSHVRKLLSTIDDMDSCSSGNDNVMNWKNATDRFALQDKLKSLLTSKSPSSYDKKFEEILAMLDKMFRKYLRCPSSLPLHEVFYFDDGVSTIRNYIIGNPRGVIHTALANPQTYINCNCCNLTDVGSVPSSLPAISIVYKLHLESGKFINLYDWLQAYTSIVHDGGEDLGENLEEIYQAQFSEAAGELEFLGFIAPTKKKTDHVMRLTWD